MANYSAFSYKAGKSFVHKLPSQVKILFIPLFNIAIFSLDWHIAASFILIQFILFCFLRFTLKEQLTDLRENLKLMVLDIEQAKKEIIYY